MFGWILRKIITAVGRTRLPRTDGEITLPGLAGWSAAVGRAGAGGCRRVVAKNALWYKARAFQAINTHMCRHMRWGAPVNRGYRMGHMEAQPRRQS